MATARERRRKPHNAPRPELARAPKEERSLTGLPVQALPEWRWKTTPVFLALGIGLFIGTMVGVPSGVASANGNGVASLVLFAVSALVLGAGVSRVTTRWILSRRLGGGRERGRSGTPR